MIKFKKGDKVLLNSLKDFSQDQGQQDWMRGESRTKILEVKYLGNYGGYNQMEFTEVGFYNACNRFALMGDV